MKIKKFNENVNPDDPYDEEDWGPTCKTKKISDHDWGEVMVNTHVDRDPDFYRECKLCGFKIFAPKNYNG